jgi:hypothetical protein
MDQLNPDVPYLLDYEPNMFTHRVVIQNPFHLPHRFTKEPSRYYIVSTFDTAYEDMTPR